MSSEWRSASSSSRILASYEISDDLNRRQIQVLERRYGGRLRAHTAATRIQRAFRQYRMLQQWLRLVVPLQHRSTLALRSADGVTQWRLGERTASQDAGSNRTRAHHAHSEAPAPKPIQHSSYAFPYSCSNLQGALPSRYHPAVPLSAQLRASRTKERHSSPSPCRAVAECTAHRPFIELMSPRLTHRRIVADSSSPANHVWVPRCSAFSSRPSHTNSLPRLDTRSTNTSASVDAGREQQLLSDQHRRRQYRIALNFFNKKPDRGIEFLLKWNFVEESAHAVAKLLIGRRGLSKQMIGEYLGQLRDPFHSAVLDCFVDEIDLHGMEIDVALRHALTFFRLPGEAQKIERIMQVFSRRYITCNPDRAAVFHNTDTLFIVSYAIIMLNTDLHKPKTKSHPKMKLEDFIKNLRGIDAGRDIDRSVLTGIYERIRDHEFRPGSDHVTQVMKVDQRIVGKDKPKLVEPQRRLVCYCRLNQVLDRAKRQAVNSHQREVFLFNDLMLISKAISKKKACSQYRLKYWTSLIGLRIRLFDNAFYHFGISVLLGEGQEVLLNAKNDDDRHRFVADVRESIAECTEMEAIRIECELDKHSGLSRNEIQRDSGLPDIDGVPSAPNGRCLSNGSANSANAVPLSSRRLSFNSLDSGVVEEHTEFAP